MSYLGKVGAQKLREGAVVHPDVVQRGTKCLPLFVQVKTAAVVECCRQQFLAYVVKSAFCTQCQKCAAHYISALPAAAPKR